MIDYVRFWLFILLFFASLLMMLMASKLLRPSNPNPVKKSTYECGQPPRGEAHNFTLPGAEQYFIYALIFFVFDSVLWILMSYAVAARTFLSLVGFTIYFSIIIIGFLFFIKSLSDRL